MATTHLLWVDLETTGSDVEHDCIIEVGAILTTTALDFIAEFTSVVSPLPLGLGRMMSNPIVRTMHETNGLLAEVTDLDAILPPIHAVTRTMLEWLAENGAKPNHVVLAGSGVGHFDRKFIARFMPQLDKFMRHWCIDIGVVRRAHEMWVGSEVSTANDRKTHRALDDIHCHLDEARAYAALWMTNEVNHATHR